MLKASENPQPAEAEQTPRWRWLPPTRGLELYYALLLVALATGLAEVLFRTFGLTRLSPVFLTPVLLAGVWLGMRPAIFAAFISFTIYNFYLVEPRFRLTLADPEDYMNLVVFLGVALFTGGITGRLRDQTSRTRRQAQALDVLFRASRTMSLSTEEEVVLDKTRSSLAEVTGSPAAVWRPGAVTPADLGRLERAQADQVRKLAREAVANDEVETLDAGPFRARLMKVDQKVFGVAMWTSANAPGELDRDQLASVLTDLGAATAARVRLTSEGAEAAAIVRMEKLRTALLSSVSHDLRTPLSAILASSSSLAEYGEAFTSEVRRDLAQNIQQEAEGLSLFVSNLLSMTRLESGALDLKLGRVRPLEMVHEVAERLERRRGGERRIVVREPEGEVHAVADPLLLAQAVTNVLDNALRYCPPPLPVEVSIEKGWGTVEVTVADWGPGVPAEHVERIFEKFYRVGEESRSGSGLGLSIARGMLEAMGGSISAERRPDGPGLAVRMTLVESPDA